jgi:hypothetical protein
MIENKMTQIEILEEEACFNVRNGSIHESYFNFLDINCFKTMATVLKNSITKIFFHGCGGFNIKNTEERKTFHDNVIKVIRMFPSLTSLYLTFFPDLTDDHFAELGFDVLENLEVLFLSQNSLLTEKTFGRIARLCGNLKSFSFSNEFDSPYKDDVYLDVKQEDINKLISGNLLLEDLHLMVVHVSVNVLKVLKGCKKLECLLLNVNVACKDSTKLVAELLASPRLLFFRFCLCGQPVFDFASKVHSIYRFDCNAFLHIENVVDDPLPIEDLINILKIHGKDVTILHFQDFPTMTEDVLKTISENGSYNLKTVRFVNCDTNFSTQSGIQNFIDQCPCLKFLFLDGYGQGGSFKILTGSGNTLHIVDRDYEDDFTYAVATMLRKKKLISAYYVDYLYDFDPERRIICRLKFDENRLFTKKRKRDI